MAIFRKFCMIFMANLLPALTMISVTVSIILGITIRSFKTDWTDRELMYIEFPGQLFLRSLKCLIIPIMVTSLISSLANLDNAVFGKIGRRAVAFYLTTTFLSIVLGIVLVLIIEPGKSDSDNNESRVTDGNSESFELGNITTVDTILDLIRNIVPDNPIEAAIYTTKTVLTPPTKLLADSNETDIYTWSFSELKQPTTNIMGIVTISLVIGTVIAKMGDSAEPVKNFFTSFNEIIMTITTTIIKLTPLGVFFLIIPRILSVVSVEQLLKNVSWYTFTVLFGIGIHATILLPSIYFTMTRKNPYTLISKLSTALATAFGTSSSTATLPVTIQCLEEKAGIDSRVARSLIPIGSVINMDGTALYEAVAALFIAQSRGVELNFTKIVITSITATAASIGAAGIPQAGLVTMVIVLNALGLPASDISLIYMVDWALDRFRTVLNVMGDSFGAAIIYHLCHDDLDNLDRERAKPRDGSVYFISEKIVNEQNEAALNNFELKE